MMETIEFSEDGSLMFANVLYCVAVDWGAGLWFVSSIAPKVLEFYGQKRKLD